MACVGGRRWVVGLILLVFAWHPAVVGAQALAPAQPATAQPSASQPEQSADAAEQPPGLGTLFKKYPTDLKRFWSKQDAVSLGIGGGIALLGHIWDDDLREELTENPDLNDVLKPGNTYGAFYLQTGVAFGTYVIGRAAGRAHLAAVSADVVRAQFLSQTYAQLIKVAARRERPDGSRYSFPSGHAASAFTTASVLQHHYGYKMGIPAYTLAAYVAAARISDNKHYLSDVIFGAAIGFASGHTVMLGHRKHSMEITPVPTRGGVALVVTIGPKSPVPRPQSLSASR